MRIATLLALLVCVQAYAEEPYPEHAGAKYPAEHWRLQIIHRPCDEYCRAAMDYTVPGFESYSRKSCVRKGIERMEASQEAPVWLEEAVTVVGFNCTFIREDDSI